MNWIERLSEIKGKDPYSQHGEGILLEYILLNVFYYQNKISSNSFVDIGCGDRFILSNTRYQVNVGYRGIFLDKESGQFVTVENIFRYIPPGFDFNFDFLSIDIDGNDYWIIQKLLTDCKPAIIIAEFNAQYSDSRAIKYDPDFVWTGDSYYGFSFEAGKKLAEANGYKVIFQVADCNMIMVMEDLINVPIPEVTYTNHNSFKLSERTDWVMI